jgi:transglutaminase-like putative cysteine protease
MENYLQPTDFLEVNHISTRLFCDEFQNISNKKQLAIELYNKTRDYFLYDPFHLDLRPFALKSSSIFSKKRAWCSEKAIILATCARYFDIPSRLGYAIVQNHIGTDKLEKYLKRPEIVFHGYVELFLNDKWIKCTPAFDKRICQIAKVTPLSWNGETDSLFQEFENETKFMEYLFDYGTFDDVPIELMNQEMQKYYPHLYQNIIDTKDFLFYPMNYNL